MGDQTYKAAVRADIAMFGKRFCTSCQTRQDVEGGKWLKNNNGMNQRWKCGPCLQRARDRKLQRAAQTADTVE